MAFWQIRTAKAYARFTAKQYYWGNNYYTEAPDYAGALSIAHAVIEAERFILTADPTYCQLESVGVHNMADVDRYWYIDGLADTAGLWVSDGPPMALLGPCVYVTFGTQRGAGARKWYRAGVDMALWNQGQANASFAAAFRNFAESFESIRPWLYRADGSPMPGISGWEVTTLRPRHGTLRYHAYAYV